MAASSCELARWPARTSKTIVNVGNIAIGGEELAIIAGPCAVESREQVMTIAACVAELGISLFRAGVYKPRTSPYSFQGLGEPGLKLLAEVRDRFGLLIVTEARDTDVVNVVEDYADLIQIGARNMQNYGLLRRVGRCTKPVLLKRGLTATIEEFLLAAEYILLEGNQNVILCERGIRTFSDHMRFTLDIGAVPSLRRLTHLPILVDPSHSAGEWEKVIPLARAGVAVGADGLLVEVHHDPARALCDGRQALTPDLLSQMIREARQIASILQPERSAADVVRLRESQVKVRTTEEEPVHESASC